MQQLHSVRGAIQPLDALAMEAALARQATLTKPPGSLGRLEELAVWLAGVSGNAIPAALRSRAVLVLAADHGVARRGVSAYPQEVTAQMVRNFASGGAAINALARGAGARVVVADFGVAASLDDLLTVRRHASLRGTQDMTSGPAMTLAQATAAVEHGIALLDAEAELGLDVVCLGEMGIGNTTAASAITAAITRADPDLVTGRGTGIDDAALAGKRAVVAQALLINKPNPDDGLAVLSAVGGLEIAGLAGVILAAAARRIPVVLDGYITGAAALIAVTIAPAACPYLVAGHRSVEPGHTLALDHLGLRPLLELNLRLGEGTGAVLALSLLDAALAAHSGMATFADAGVAGEEIAARQSAGDV